MKYCDMKGFLSFLILWELHKHPMNGTQIAKELERRKGNKPSPGTIYPALKELKTHNLIIANETKVYKLTKRGEKELQSACRSFCCIFYDASDMEKKR